MTPQRPDVLVFALPKGRILDETLPLLIGAGVRPEPAFFDPKSRMLQFETNRKDIRLVRVRSFDVPAFVASGAAAMGVAGSDVLEEHGYDNIYSPLDLHIGKCRLSEAAPLDCRLNLGEISHVRVATKYPNLAKAFYAARGVQAECIKLHGAMELAPQLGMCDRIVDLVSTGATLRENRLKETETIMHVTSRLAVNRSCYTFYAEQINGVVASLEEGVRRAAA